MFLTPELIQSDLMKVLIMAELHRQFLAKRRIYLAGWNFRNPEKVKAKQVKYNKTEKSKARLERYAKLHPDRIEQAQAKYYRTEKCKATRSHWEKNNPDSAKSRHKKYRLGHADVVAARRKRYNQTHAEQISASSKLYRQANAKKVRASNKAHYHKNYEKYKPRVAAYHRAHKEVISRQGLARHHKKYRTDPAYKIACLVRGRLKHAVNRKRMSVRTQQLVGCTFKELANHIESQFQPGMTWDNHGLRGWHVDHIKPVSSFDFTDPSQIADCFHYSNLQPLWWLDNARKGDKLDYVVPKSMPATQPT